MKTVNEVLPGDVLWVENHWGDFEKQRVVAVERYRVVIPGKRFAKKTGWEILYKSSRADLLAGIRDRYRIHNGDGVLYTDEYVQHYRKRQALAAQQTELIYSLLRTSPVLWRRLTLDQLEQIKDWLYEEPK